MSAPAPSMFTPAAKAMAEKLGLKMGRANLEEFATTLDELAKLKRAQKIFRPHMNSKLVQKIFRLAAGGETGVVTASCLLHLSPPY